MGDTEVIEIVQQALGIRRWRATTGLDEATMDRGSPWPRWTSLSAILTR